MKNLFKGKIFYIFFHLLFLLLFAKFLSVVLLWFLPASKESFSSDEAKNFLYRNFDFSNVIKGRSKEQIEQTDTEEVQRDKIADMILIGLYGNKRYGYVIVATKKSPQKTAIVSLGEKYHGYRLKRVALDYVVFVKNKKEYILRFSSVKNRIKTLKKENDESFDNSKETLSVFRSDINAYTKDPTQIWKDISISEINKDGKIYGFKVTKIAKNSKIAKLGLKRGDIIVKANGEELTSYNRVFKIYRDINRLERIVLGIKRGDQTKEIVYEIH